MRHRTLIGFSGPWLSFVPHPSSFGTVCSKLRVDDFWKTLLVQKWSSKPSILCRTFLLLNVQAYRWSGTLALYASIAALLFFVFVSKTQETGSQPQVGATASLNKMEWTGDRVCVAHPTELDLKVSDSSDANTGGCRTQRLLVSTYMYPLSAHPVGPMSPL